MNDTKPSAPTLAELRREIDRIDAGMHALLMEQGCQDFITGREAQLMTFFSDRIDIHHIFPKAWCIKQGIPPSVFNSIVNKTPLFNLNGMTAAEIEGIEVYSSASQVPAQYNKTSGGCGVMLIWTRVGR